MLEDGDVVHVPQAAKVFVTGHVREGGGFPLRGDLTILRALALAGGLDDHATPSETVLIRRVSDGRQADGVSGRDECQTETNVRPN